jgi:uncharacterized protein YdeI (YjbR/CyaY-like superfamily)
MIKEGKITAAGQKMIDLAKKSGTWKALDKINELKLPTDLVKALARDKKAKDFFALLLPPKKEF